MYTIVFKKRAKKFIDGLLANERLRIVKAIEKLPDSGDIKSVKGYDKLFRLRVGDYRIIYSVDNGRLVIMIIDAGNRGQLSHFVFLWRRHHKKTGTAGRRSLGINRTLAGVAYPCISRVSPVSTFGVWMPRNCPPQSPFIAYSYYITIISFCKVFF